MSTVLTIERLVGSGELIPYRQQTVNRQVNRHGPRYIWLTPGVQKWVFPADDHPDSRINDDSLAALLDVMNRFIRGDWLEIDLDVKRLCPDETDIWTIRSHLQQPQLRLFGWFVLPKLFVAVHPMVRDDLENGKGPKWDAAITKAADIRTSLMREAGSLFYSWDPRDYAQNPK